MSAADAQAEPTMEEILASIRRIISEDDSTAPAAEAAPVAEPDFGDEVLELNEPVVEMPETVSPDFDFDALPVDDAPEVALEEIIVEDRVEEPEPEPEPEPVAPPPAPVAVAPMPEPVYVPAPEPEPAPFPFDQGLVSNPIADKTSSVFAKLAPNTTLPGMFISGNTVEAMVGELIKPMLKEWLDANLPRIVEEKVEAEVARIARRSF
jgi:cell pole-organizing protein PopZ